MSQINLDTSPYFDDFEADKDYYKVLFKPGFPVQARELTSLQSILQNQISTFGEHFFKEGAMVIPGGISYNPQYTAVILNPQQGGIDITLYLDQLVGKTIIGDVTGIRARVIDYLIPPKDGVNNPTIFVTYTDSGNDDRTVFFTSNESLILEEPLVYGNTTITANSTFATTITTNPTAVGTAAEIADGVYFVRGTFVQVTSNSIVLEPYSVYPSYRVGLQITEQIVTAGQDPTLYDNAKGFNNFSAPGADRLKIELTLTKKPLNDFNDTNFVELLRLDRGEVKKLEIGSNYNIIKDYIAQRTFEESGDYIVEGIRSSVDESLNDNIGNNGVYLATQTTEEGGTPSPNLAILKVSPGKAYVRGFDVAKSGTTNLDAPKPRTTETQKSTAVPFEIGSKYFVNNVISTPVVGLDVPDNIVELYDGRLDSAKNPTGSLIGEARIYSYSLEDSAYINAATPWNVYLYDLQIFTRITVNVPIGGKLIPGFRIQGLSSNASGYVRSINGSDVFLTDTSGEFIRGEQFSVNGSTEDRFSTTNVVVYKQNQVKSLFQDTSSLNPNIATNFRADTRLYSRVATNFTPSDSFTITAGGLVTCPGRFFDSFNIGDVVVWQDTVNSTLVYNTVTSFGVNDTSMVIAPVANVNNVASGALPSGTRNNVNLRVTESRLLNTENSALYLEMEKKNISKVNLNSSQLYFTTQIYQETTVGSTLTINRTLTGVNDALFVPFDQERYSIVYNDGVIETISSEQFEISNDSTVIIFNGLTRINEVGITVNVTAIKPSIKSKSKILTKSQELLVDKVSVISSPEFGMIQNDYYGLRVEDEEISLNTADVEALVAVYESLDANPPTLDILGFTNGLSLETSTVKGETIRGATSGAVAKLVQANTPSTIRIVYLSQNPFTIGETLVFDESNIKTNLQAITPGNYKDITDKYTLDKGQREQFYDFSRIVRNRGASAPNKRLLVVFDQFNVPDDDSGDFYTANSYVEEIFNKGVPLLRDGTLRASDTLDFRPRVADFTSTSASPFDYSSRDFAASGSTVVRVTAPAESMTLGYDYYVGRKDRLVLNKLGELKLIFGAPAFEPQLPEAAEAAMEVARITYPAYVYNVDDIKIETIDNRRYTMRDIGGLEDRIESLEEVTSLSLLERRTDSLQVLDADGNDRFKSGFFADDFSSASFVAFDNPETAVNVNPDAGSLDCQFDFATVGLQLQLDPSINPDDVSLEQNLPLVDSSTKKTGDLVTLNYDEVPWLEQPLASRTENVNPFNVILYDGQLVISPSSDDFIISRTVGTTRETVFGTEASNFSRNFVQSTDRAQFMRERNIAFRASAIKPLTQFFPFFEGSSGADFIPKLIEITMRSGTFEVGESVEVSSGNNTIFSARVATQNHKSGPFDAPTQRFTTNPYTRTEQISDDYSASSSVLNIDLASLSDVSDERYFGYISTGLRLVGTRSGAVADISNLRLVSDAFCDLAGSIFFRDPLSSPAPAFRLRTGIRTLRLSSSPTNEEPELGQTIISFAEATYTSGGTIENRVTTLVTVRVPPPPPRPLIIVRQPITNVTNVTNVTNIISRPAPPPRPAPPRDPLAQTFRVDESGAFLTSVDIFMATKSETDNLTVQIRPTALATPAANRLQDYAEVVLSPDQINVSSDASVPTRVTFPSPIYLEPEVTYALVLLAPTTDLYTAWIARMGEENVTNPANNVGGTAIISQQYLNGSLFKSQNGSLWTANQFEDLKFVLYKAAFDQVGTIFLNNQPVLNDTLIPNNPIRTLPRRLRLPIAPSAYPFTVGQKLASSASGFPNDPRVTGDVESLGGAALTTVVSSGGIGYVDGAYTSVELFNIASNGSNAVANVNVSGGEVISVSITAAGTGYVVGDTVGITTANVGGIGGDAVISIDSIGNTDTVIMTNVIGQRIITTDALNDYNIATNQLTDTGVTIVDNSEVADPMNGGDVFVVDLPSHGMMADNNLVTIINTQPDTKGTDLVEGITISSNQLTIADQALFSSFEGISTSTGYLIVGGEIMEYDNNGDGTLGITSRGVDGSPVNIHDQGSRVFKYEMSGVSLRRINTSHPLPTDQLLGYTRDYGVLPLVIDRGSRSNDFGITPYIPQLSFNQDQQAGGNRIRTSQNFQFNTLFPSIGLLTPGNKTQVSSQIRTVSGTSAGGDEQSFIDQGNTPIALNAFTSFNSPRLVASVVNEVEYLQDLPNNKSLTMALTFRSDDSNLSPVLDMNQVALIGLRSALNNPVTNYPDDPRTNRIIGDPHRSIYISQKVLLENPATSLKVILSAYRDETADFRVAYRLFAGDTQGATEPSWVLFPGYDNLLDTDGDGFGDEIIDPSKNSGLPNKKVRASRLIGPSGFEDLEYLYDVDSLPEFSGFQIKVVFSGTNEARSPSLSDIRAIALA